MAFTANAATAVQVDARAPGTLKIFFTRICNKKAGKHEQALSEHARRRQKLTHVSVKVVRQQAVRVSHSLNVVSRVFRQPIVVERRTVGVNAAPFAKEAYAA